MYPLKPEFLLDLKDVQGSPAENRGAVNTLLDILKKDRTGGFLWVEAVNDIETAKARLLELSATSTDEFVVFRNIDLRIVATSRSALNLRGNVATV